MTYLNDEFFSRLETLALNLKPDLSGYFGGKHLVSTYGQTVEFADFREYQLGDDIRRIDWNLYSRFEKFFLKLFTDERQMKIQIFIDCSASMGKDNPAKGAYTLAAAAALGFLGVHNMDKVSFNLMRATGLENNYGTIIGKNSFFRAVSDFSNIRFEGETDIERCITKCNTLGNADGLSVIVSDFFTESNWKKAVDYLRYHRQQVLLLQILTPEECDPLYDGRVNLMDSEAEAAEDPKNMKLKITRAMRNAYEEALNEFKADIKTFCAKRGADYISVCTDSAIERVLFGELLKTGIVS